MNNNNNILCRCGFHPQINTVKDTNKSNFGREYYTCESGKCDYWKWVRNDIPIKNNTKLTEFFTQNHKRGREVTNNDENIDKKKKLKTIDMAVPFITNKTVWVVIFFKGSKLSNDIHTRGVFSSKQKAWDMIAGIKRDLKEDVNSFERSGSNEGGYWWSAHGDHNYYQLKICKQVVQ